MNDWGFFVFFILSFAGGFQILANFVIEPLIKKKNGEDYKFNWFVIIFVIIYFIFIITIFILVLTGVIVYYIE